tara:strand:- start:1292 stop:1921 length:630 start_codon:yes stop_codon:yes gene_type:complete
MISLDEINKFGFFLDKRNIFNINENHHIEAKEIVSSDNIKCHFLDDKPLKNIKIIHNPEKFSYLNNTYKKIKNFIDIKNKTKLDSIWVQKTTKQSSHFDPTKLPYIPHIDKKRMFKIMIYLNDVIKDNGPINLIKCDTNKYEKLRSNLGENYKEKSENTITDLCKNEFTSCEGPVGTVIFFDTNCPHFAGNLKSDNDYRLIYRFNFEYC